MTNKKEKLIRGHRRESALFTLPELQDLRGKIRRRNKTPHHGIKGTNQPDKRTRERSREHIGEQP